MNPANRESLPSFPKLIFCIQIGKSSRVVSVASKRAEMISNTNGKTSLNVSYNPSSGPNAILAAMINGNDKNRPS